MLGENVTQFTPCLPIWLNSEPTIWTTNTRDEHSGSSSSSDSEVFSVMSWQGHLNNTNFILEILQRSSDQSIRFTNCIFPVSATNRWYVPKDFVELMLCAMLTDTTRVHFRAYRWRRSRAWMSLIASTTLRMSRHSTTSSEVPTFETNHFPNHLFRIASGFWIPQFNILLVNAPEPRSRLD